MRLLNQFVLLLWKNYLLQKRKVVVTLIEVALPAIFAALLILIRQRVNATPHPNATSWEPFSSLKPISICPIPPPMCFLDKWKVYYSPQNNLTARLMNNALKKMSSRRVQSVIGFATEDDLVKDFMGKMENASRSGGGLSVCDILGGVVFTNIDTSDTVLPQSIEYKIRLPYTPRLSKSSFSLDPTDDDTNWHTEFMFPMNQKVGPRVNWTQYSANPGYYQEGFLMLQGAVDLAIISEVSPESESVVADMWRYPYPPYNRDMFILVLQTQFPFIVMLSFVFSALQIVKDVVHEKERKLKESMRMMGLAGWLHWAAWFTKHLLFLFVSVCVMTLLFSVSTGEHGSVIGYTNSSVLLVFLLLYAIATINFCFAVSVFFSRANSGAAAGGILFFVTYVPYAFLQRRYQTLSFSTKISTCLFSNVAMSYGAQIIGMFEGTGAGVQWSSVNEGVSVDDSFTMMWVFIMLIVDAVIYALVAWYIEAVWPGEYGVPQPWYFPIQRSYWCGVEVPVEDPVSESTPLLSPSSSSNSSQSGFIESDPTEFKGGICIQNLRKVFKTGGKEKVAVEGMTLSMYEGQITALLGHNGAGKTTTMSMLTGFFPPTSGSALVNGHDIRTDMAGVRQSLGLCPQHNVLFDTLTVEEHLKFFAKLKGCPAAQVSAEIDRFLMMFDLEAKRHEMSKTLSGGMKRKLSVGIALIGGSKVVILDEPTSGMDPNARRQTWDVLQRHREGRTMVLSTHYMDEADILADRIAIMAEGVIQCCGSPLFLKNKYGAGYHMVMVKDAGCVVDIVTGLVTKHVPAARLESNVSMELSYILPHESKAHFALLFDELEERRAELCIASYGASVTTMEEVFLKVGEMKDNILHSRSASYSSLQRLRSNRLEDSWIDTRKTSFPLFLQQFRAMFWKRVLHTLRNRLVTCTQLLVPLLYTILILVVLKTLPRPQDSAPLELNMARFDQNYAPYSTDQETDDLGRIYAALFKGGSTIAQKVNLTESMDDYLVGIGRKGIAEYNSRYILAMQAAKINNKTKLTAYFNAQGYHTAGIALHSVNNMLLNYVSNGSYQLHTVNHPFPRTVENAINDQLTRGFDGFMIAVNLVFGMSFLASSFVLFLIRERTLKAKHCQFVSGVKSWTFWAATFCWDLINFSIPCVLIIITFALFGVTAYTTGAHCFYILLMFLMYGCALLPFMYVFSFVFTVPASGFVWLSMLNILSGIATVLAVNILKIPGLGTKNISDILDWIFLVLLPNFNLGQGLIDFYNNYQFLQICEVPIIEEVCKANITNPCCKNNCGDQCLDYTENYLSWEAGGIGRYLVFLTCQGFLYFTILFVMESHVIQRIWYFFRPELTREPPTRDSGVVEDSDVALERQRISAGNIEDLMSTEALLIQDLTKYYGDHLAVNRLSLGVQEGECFGLLGTNGAGKTSTFKMLTGDEIVSSGNAYLNQFDIRNNIQKVRQQLGYCPQFDALIDELTGRETLTMYAQLRGVPSTDIQDCVQSMITCLLLDEHADKTVKTYSGGNKRKLSTAIALIGDPPIVFLDEPSTGMDPIARRSLWDTLSDIRANGRTLILTSHSMEECEALCTKIAIMVNGQFKCLGSTQHLKNKFGEGFTLIAKVSPSIDGSCDTRPLIEHIMTQFPGSVVKDVHYGMVHIHITDTSTSWSQLFGTMEQIRGQYKVEDYSVSQTTLEQVFINFARSQVEPIEPRSGCCQQGSCTMCCLCLCCCHARGQHSVNDVDCQVVSV